MTSPRAAIAGVGYAPFSRESGRSVLDLAVQACRAAVDDAGLDVKDVDGISSFMLMHDSVPCQAVATALALPQLTYSLDVQLGGQAPSWLVWQAATAVRTNQARYVLVFRAMNGRSESRVGAMQFPGGGAPHRYAVGYDAYMMYVAMWARRFLTETGQTERDLAEVAVAQRAYALDNPRAIKRRALDVATHQASDYVVAPFRPDDCTTEVDGACAVLVTTLERARSLRQPPAIIASGAYRAGPRPGLDIGDHLLWEDYTRNYTSYLAADLFWEAGVGPTDVDVAEIYDCFTSTVLMGLEGLGLCGRGESGEFVRSGATARDGALPVNTNGGLLSEGYLHGMNTVAEAALQVSGRAGANQVPRHDVGVVTSGALMDGSALILTSDR